MYSNDDLKDIEVIKARYRWWWFVRICDRIILWILSFIGNEGWFRRNFGEKDYSSLFYLSSGGKWM